MLEENPKVGNGSIYSIYSKGPGNVDHPDTGVQSQSSFRTGWLLLPTTRRSSDAKSRCLSYHMTAANDNQ